jgi:polygalacturonase
MARRLPTEAIRSAIQAAKLSGGGTVYIPAGRYISGSIELISDLVLQLEAGATVQFPAARLPYSKGRTQGFETIGPVPLIGGRDLENVTVTGRGVITTENAEWTRRMGGPTPKSDSGLGSAFGPDWNRLLELLQHRTPQAATCGSPTATWTMATTRLP